MTAERITDGLIPDLMDWKAKAVFAAADAAQEGFAEWLKSVPEGLDSFQVRSWEDQQLRQLDLYVLLGWSGSGSDDLRRATLDSAVVKGKQVDVYLSQPLVTNKEGLAGTADMQFVGWKIAVKDLAPGKYTGLLHVRHDTVNVIRKPRFEEKIAGKGYINAAELKFTIKSAK